MSFLITGNTRVGLKVTGYNEVIAATEAIRKEMPQTKMKIHRSGSTYFVLRAKERVHRISGDLGRSIEVETITAERAIVSAGKGLKYAYQEERRKGNRRTAPNTPHAFMKPAAVDTSLVMGRYTKQEFDALWAKHKTR